MKYIRSDGAESGGVFSIVNVTENEIESFVSDGPWSKDMKEVTINFKDGMIKDLACGSITVPITVISPDEASFFQMNYLLFPFLVLLYLQI